MLRKEKGPAKCHITGTINSPKITIDDGSLVLRQPDHKEPIIAADGIQMSMRVEDTDSGRVIAVEPFEVFKKRKLNWVPPGLVRLPEAPDVERQVDGEISLSFSKLRIPLGAPKKQVGKQLEAEGKFTLHQVSSEVKCPLWQAVIRLVADLNGKKASGKIRLVVDSEVPFKVRDGRLHHEGMRVGFPDIDPEMVVARAARSAWMKRWIFTWNFPGRARKARPGSAWRRALPEP